MGFYFEFSFAFCLLPFAFFRIFEFSFAFCLLPFAFFRIFAVTLSVVEGRYPYL